MIKEMIKKAAEGIDLTYDEAAEVTREIMTGSTTPAQTAAYLTALHIKGETTDEISASAYVMRRLQLHQRFHYLRSGMRSGWR